MLGLSDLTEIGMLDIPALRAALHAPVTPIDLLTDGNIFHTIRECKNLLVHHPGESFQHAERFLVSMATTRSSNATASCWSSINSTIASPMPPFDHASDQAATFRRHGRAIDRKQMIDSGTGPRSRSRRRRTLVAG